MRSMIVVSNHSLLRTLVNINSEIFRHIPLLNFLPGLEPKFFGKFICYKFFKNINIRNLKNFFWKIFLNYTL